MEHTNNVAVITGYRNFDRLVVNRKNVSRLDWLFIFINGAIILTLIIISIYFLRTDIDSFNYLLGSVFIFAAIIQFINLYFPDVFYFNSRKIGFLEYDTLYHNGAIINKITPDIHLLRNKYGTLAITELSSDLNLKYNISNIVFNIAFAFVVLLDDYNIKIELSFYVFIVIAVFLSMYSQYKLRKLVASNSLWLDDPQTS